MIHDSRTSRISRRRTLLALAALAGHPLAARAAYPDKPIRLVVPFPPGGAGDLVGRALGHQLSQQLGQQVVIDNRAGAGGGLACEIVARAPADGHTLLLATMGTHAINPALYAKLRYDPVKDFAPIALTNLTPRILIVGPSVKAANVQEFRTLAAARPGRLTYGSAGVGSSGHLAGALFESLAKVDMVHVPYKGSAPLLTDLLAGRVDATFDAYPVYEEHIKAGRVQALAVTSRTRMGLLPHLPTLAESGLPGYEVSNWIGLMAPAGTPADVLAALHKATARATADAGLRRQFIAAGIEPVTSTPEEFAALVRTEQPRWSAIVARSGATAE